MRTRAPRSKDTQPLTLRLTPEEIAKVDKYAAKDSRSRAGLAHLFFLKCMQDYERETLAKSSV